MSESVRVMLPEEKVNQRIAELGEEISKEFAGEPVHLICILKGSVFFTCELAKRITVPVTMDFMTVSSYGSGTTSSGNVKIKKDLDEDIAGKNVVVIEDIIDTGRTLACLLEILKERNPKKLKLCTLLDKPNRRIAEERVEYTGFVIPEENDVRKSLDYNQRNRNLPYVGVLDLG